MTQKLLIEGINNNLTDLKDPYTICILTKSNIILKGHIFSVSIFSWVHASNGFSFLNIEGVREFNSTFVTISHLYHTPLG